MALGAHGDQDLVCPGHVDVTAIFALHPYTKVFHQNGVFLEHLPTADTVKTSSLAKIQSSRS